MEDFDALANDESVLATWPDAEISSVRKVHESPWAKGFCVTVRQADGREESYFMKVSSGNEGRLALDGEFASISAILEIMPDFCPEPIVVRSFKSDQNRHFFISKFFNFKKEQDIPKSVSFYKNLALLHSSHTSPDGKFGFHCTTYNGNIPQDNTWCDSWEEFFTMSLRRVLAVLEERGGQSVELDALLPNLFANVIPRLLRPLQEGGRKIKPALVHGDLWRGNIGIVNDAEVVVYDPASFWAHNEYELGNWRPERNKFTADDREKYHRYMDKSEPQEDYDDRAALYALKFNLHAAALFPNNEEYIKLVIGEVRELNKKYPGESKGTAQ